MTPYCKWPIICHMLFKSDWMQMYNYVAWRS